MKRVALNLIVSAGLACSLAATAASSRLLVKDGERIAFLGDSITQNGDCPCGYVNLVMAGLRAEGLTNVVKIAAGRSGNRSTQMLARIDGVLKQKPTFMFISCGVNDVWHQEHKGPDGKHTGVELPDYMKNMREMYDRCDTAGVKVGIMTATMITENADDQKNKWLVPYNDFLRAEAKARGYLLVDCNKVMWEALAKVRAKDKTPGNKLTKDGVHMNETGDCMLASALLKGLGVRTDICGSYEDGYAALNRLRRDLPGGAWTIVHFTRREKAAFMALAKERKRRPEDLGHELYLKGVEIAREKRTLPPPAPKLPKPEIPAAPAASVKVKDGEQLAFMGGYWMECASAKGYLMEQTVRGLELAGVKKPRYVPCSTRWASSEDLVKHVDKVFARKTEWIVFCGEVDDYRKTPPGTLATIEANLGTAFDKLGASGRKVVLMTYPPILGPKGDIAALNDFIRAEAKARGFVLADIAKAILEAKAGYNYGVYEGNAVAARELLGALGVPAATIDYVGNETLDTPGTGDLYLATTINERAAANGLVFELGGNEDEFARDLLTAMTDEKTRAAWDKVKPGPRRVLNLPRAKGNPRNGEGDLIRLKDGRILFVYTEYRGESNLDHAPAYLVKCYSSDGGETWTKPVEAVPRSGRQNDMSVSLIRLMNGRIGLFYLRKNSGTDCMPVVRFSSDEGKTWSGETECVAASDTAYWVLNNARLTMLKSGRLIAPLSRHNPSDGQLGRLMCVYSDDQGATWRSGRLYEPPKDEKGKPVIVQEPGVVELKDGRLYLYARTDRGRQWQAFSKDGGVTWEDFGPSPIYGPRGPATIRRLKSGDLLLVWNDHEGLPEYMKRGPAWLVGIRAPLTLAISKDEGRTWINRKTIETDMKGFFCYFSVLEQDDGLLLAYYNQPNLAGCCLTKVPFDWLLAK